MGMFISTLVVIDTFFVSYYLGMHSRSVPVIDNSMKPVVPVVVPVKAAPKTPIKKDEKPGAKPASKHPPKAAPKSKVHSKAAASKNTGAKKTVSQKNKP